MILYYSPGACSLAPHVALQEAGADYEARRVVLADGEHRTPEYLAINPRARVPALDDGQGVITENVAILNYLGAIYGAQGSVPVGDPHRAARCNELLSWFASSVHIGFAQLWRAERFTDDEALHGAIQVGGRTNLRRYFQEIEALCGSEWVVPGSFTAADTYLMIFFRWGIRIEEDMARYPDWAELVARVLARPAVQRTIVAEGLNESQFQPA